MERLRTPLLVTCLLVLLPVLSACGESDPDPATVLDRALTRENLSGFGEGLEGPAGGVVAVQSLGYEDAILRERQVAASPQVMSDIRSALGDDSGLRALADEFEFEGTGTVGGVEVNHVSGSIDVAGLARALRESGGEDVGALAGLSDTQLEEMLARAEFDLYAGQEDGTIRKLDLTLSFDDPDNALPATRIRFSLTPDTPGQTFQ